MFLPNKNCSAYCVRRTTPSDSAVLCTYHAVRNQAGFTLIEVLVAIVILATGLVLVIEGMARTQQAMRISENLMRVSSLAEEKSTQIQLKIINVRKMGLSRNREKVRIEGREFSVDENISPYDDPSLKDQTRLSQADIAIFWQENARRSNEFVLSSLIRNRDKKEMALGQSQ